MTETTIKPFSGFDLAIGAAYGVRWFNTDEWGRLRGRHYDHIWTPGENVAVCRHHESDPLAHHLYHYMYSATFGGPPPLSKQAVTARIKPTTHNVPDENCSCGFYAYAEGCLDSEHRTPTSVLGVIEAYGRTVLGTRGLRAEKARVVGLWTTDPQIIALYPDAEVYEKKRDLLAAFDVVTKYVRTPENDPNFWTRP